jgi:hypothetical protein
MPWILLTTFKKYMYRAKSREHKGQHFKLHGNAREQRRTEEDFLTFKENGVKIVLLFELRLA